MGRKAQKAKDQADCECLTFTHYAFIDLGVRACGHACWVTNVSTDWLGGCDEVCCTADDELAKWIPVVAEEKRAFRAAAAAAGGDMREAGRRSSNGVEGMRAGMGSEGGHLF